MKRSAITGDRAFSIAQKAFAKRGKITPEETLVLAGSVRRQRDAARAAKRKRR